jgi:A/G-specific adenine glycosylase
VTDINNDLLAPKLLRWYERYGRHDLPWQRQATPYAIWLSEIMLQQTQVTTVIPYFQRFMQRFPKLADLAAAESDEVMHYWSGLGYYARARNLHKAAQQIVDRYGGEFPRDFDKVLALPGIGRSTAGAILAQAFNQAHAILDGNVKRVLTRFHAIAGWPGETRISNTLWQWAEHHTPEQRVADYTQAIMDLGATLCTRRQPCCEQCPLRDKCLARQQGTVHLYPESKPKKKRPSRHRQMLFILDGQGRLLLHKRPPSGIWGGLWSPPELETGASARQWCQQALGIKVDEATMQLPEIEHGFSHFLLHIHPLCLQITGDSQQIMEPSETLWYNTTQPQNLGLAAPVQELIKCLTEQVEIKNQGVSNVPNGPMRQTG